MHTMQITPMAAALIVLAALAGFVLGRSNSPHRYVHTGGYTSMDTYTGKMCRGATYVGAPDVDGFLPSKPGKDDADGYVVPPCGN